MKTLVGLAVLSAGMVFIRTAWARGGSPRCTSERASQLREVVTELETASMGSRELEGALGFYARAFAGYAAVNLGLGGCLEQAEAGEMAERMLMMMLSAESRPRFGGDGSRSVAFSGHVALLLEGRALLGPLPKPLAAEQARLISGLAERVLAAPGRLLPSYGERIWPADNEVLRAALTLAGRRRADSRVELAQRTLSAALDALEASSLPPSEWVRGGFATQPPPRGCALGWTVAMRGLSGSRSPEPLYRLFRAEFALENGPVLTFREWPRNHSTDDADADSGPVVWGVGTSATGLGLAAAMLSGRVDDARKISRLADATSGLLELFPPGERAAGHAMLVWAQSARPWSTLR